MPQSDIIMIGPMRFNAQQLEVSRDGKATRLTPGESWLLRFLVDHANTAYTLSQLSLEIYGTDNADTMIKVAIRHLRQKIILAALSLCPGGAGVSQEPMTQ